MIKAYSYIRMSSGRQLKGDSLARQLELSEAFAALHDLDLDTSLRDLGVSAFDGSNRETGALAAFLRKVRAGEIERGSYLLIESLDRLSRDRVMKALRVFQDILEAGIVIATVADGHVYSEESVDENWTQLIVSLAVMSRAHEESARKADRLRAAWKRKRQQSERKLTARAPSWLKLSADRTTFEIIPERKAVVVRILEELASGIGRDKIARRLNAEGVLPWGGGREWHGGTIQKVTDTAAVIGRFQPHRLETTIVGGLKRQRRIPVGEPIEGYFPRIVSDDLWQQARAASDCRSRAGPGNAGGRRGTVFSNLLSGLPRCASCGSPMNYRDRGLRSTVVFICSGHRNGSCENGARIPYPPLERAVVDWAMFHEPAPAPVDEPAVEELATAERRMGEIKAIVERLTVAIENGEAIEPGRLAQRRDEMRELQTQVAAARRKITRRKGEVPVEQRRGVIAAVERVSGEPDEVRFATRAAANQGLRDLISEVRCHSDGSVVLHLPTYGEHVVFEGGRPEIKTWEVMSAVSKVA